MLASVKQIAKRVDSGSCIPDNSYTTSSKFPLQNDLSPDKHVLLPVLT